ncbi:hypothetical protein HFE03_03895 [Paenibacillus sp. EKM102P]|uniref:hypothetical protein n=1 Tax=unclassified Paenibacillus TaxID=185978 RepID=UPI00142DE6C8|nr:MULTISPECIES: hypothetical protein [unclassified Paenibacillus]KAF6618350.1 hypothetical protein HFE00_09730 [Paenibacillus sp. EKM101P]KAF6624696.1 hypothetical protein HFE03_03895 [Paenibacillus sp. EKM102P]KAF6648766.1 hypothetical protein HFE02_10415 [Paenibacillus sp. EKM11P]
MNSTYGKQQSSLDKASWSAQQSIAMLTSCLTKSTPCMHSHAYIRSDGTSCTAFPFLRWGDFMETAVSSGVDGIVLKKR